MALGDAIRSSANSGNGGFAGPFEVGSALYVVAQTNGTTYVYKTTDPVSGSWSIQDSGNEPVKSDFGAASFLSVHAELVGSLINIIVYEWGTSIHASQFDTSTDTWVTSGKDTDIGATLTGGGPNSRYCQMQQRSDGDLMVMYNMAISNMGSYYARTTLARRESGSWTVDIVLDNTTKNTSESLLMGSVMSVNDRLHVFWYDEATSLLRSSTYLSGNTFGEQDQSTGDAYWFTPSDYGRYRGISFTESSTDKVRMPVLTTNVSGGGDLHVYEFTDTDTPQGSSAVTDSTINTSETFNDYAAVIVVDSVLRRYAIWGTTSDDDINYFETGNGDDTWGGSSTALYNGSSMNDVQSVLGAAYLSGRDVIGVYFQDNNNVRYTEFAGAGGSDYSLTPNNSQSTSEVTSPALTQVHDITPNNAQSTSEVTSPALTQVHDLTPNNSESASEVTQPTATLHWYLTPNNAESASEVTTPAVSQVHSLTGNNSQSTSEVTTPAISQVHSLAPNDAQSTSEVTTPVMTYHGGSTYSLTPNNSESASEVTTPALTQVHDLTANNFESASEVTTPAVSQVHIVTPNNAESASEVTTPAISQVHDLTPVNAESTSEVTSPAIAQLHDLIANPTESLSEVSAPAISQVHSLTPNNAESASEVTHPALGSGSDYSLTPDNIQSITEVTTPALTQVHDLAGLDTESASEVSLPGLSQLHDLFMVAMESASEVGTPAITYYVTAYWTPEDPTADAWTPEDPTTDGWTPEDPVTDSWTPET